jgi:hypothetical protein
MTTVAPIFAKLNVVSFPIPELLPVMVHIFPFISLMSTLPAKQARTITNKSKLVSQILLASFIFSTDHRIMAL